jgi:hypothetical protein
MRSNNKMDNLKDAAGVFIDTVLKPDQGFDFDQCCALHRTGDGGDIDQLKIDKLHEYS